MIKATNLSKSFGDFYAVKDLSAEIPKGCIYGLIGANGAGKSTFLRMLTGVYRPDAGEVSLDGAPVWDCPTTKRKISFVPDELYFQANASMNRMANIYRAMYKDFDYPRFQELTNIFGLNPKASTNTFSKGMRRQAATILSLCCNPEYIFFDETFDGLDPIMRNLVKNLISEHVIERGATAIITSHSLRELEDTCDQLALLYKGGIVFESDVSDLKTSLFKVQIAFSENFSVEHFSDLDFVDYSQRGSVANFIIRGDRAEVHAKLSAKAPILLDILPLSLEEVFIHEMSALGYHFDNVLGGDEHV